MTFKTSAWALPALFTLFALGGCAADIQPAPSARPVTGLEDAAQQTASGVTIVAQADEWPGPADVSEAVTPMRVRIENQSGSPLRVRYNEFKPIAPWGAAYSALPLVQIEGDVSVSVSAFDAPDFFYDDFAVAPYYADFYPGISPYTRGFAMDAYYYNTYYDYWAEIDLPTPAMRRMVIPEGVVESGG